MTPNEMARRVVANMSPAEMRHVRNGNFEPAHWLTGKLFDLTPTQCESVAMVAIGIVCANTRPTKVTRKDGRF